MNAIEFYTQVESPHTETPTSDLLGDLLEGKQTVPAFQPLSRDEIWIDHLETISFPIEEGNSFSRV